MAKLIVDIPDRLNDKLRDVKEELMLTKSGIVKLAVNQFCDEVIKKNDVGR